MTVTSNKPAKMLRDGNLKAVIWRNEGKNGPFYSVYFSRVYKDDDGLFHDTDSFTNGDLLRLSHMASKSHDAMAELRANDTKEAGQ